MRIFYFELKCLYVDSCLYYSTHLDLITSDLLSLKIKNCDCLSNLLNVSWCWWPKSKTKFAEGKQQLIIIELLTKHIAINNCCLFVLRHCKKNTELDLQRFIIFHHYQTLAIAADLELDLEVFFTTGSRIFQLSINKPEMIHWPFRRQKARALWPDRVSDQQLPVSPSSRMKTQSPTDHQRIGRPIRDFCRTERRSRQAVHQLQILMQPRKINDWRVQSGRDEFKLSLTYRF